jgi:prepilin-type processing-associated H-X9-DG protein
MARFNYWFNENKVAKLRRSGFGLVELLATLGTIFVLLGLALPAIQQSREAARRTACLSQLRQLGLGAQGFLTARTYFPGPRVNQLPSSAGYVSDTGLFVEILPYLEQRTLHLQFDPSRYIHSMEHRPWLVRSVPLLRCPSTGEAGRLTDIASKISGTAVPGLESITCDYSGSGGVWDFSNRLDGRNGGVVKLRIGLHPGVRIPEVRDGLSHTFFAWESAGDGLHLPFGQEAAVSFSVGAPDSFEWRERAGSFQSSGRPSSLSYLYSWCGFRTGSLSAWSSSGEQVSPWSGQGSVINRTNRFGEPFSRHPNGANFANADGSVEFVSDEIDAKIISSKVAIADGPSNLN